jgi:hypothetical protein
VGYSFIRSCQTKKALADYLLKNQYQSHREVIDQKLNEDGLWTVLENTRTKEREIVLFHMELTGSKKTADLCWGYKSIPESMFPYYFNCPKRFFKWAPIVTCQQWRDLCLQPKSQPVAS